jgi:hypothetical protein
MPTVRVVGRGDLATQVLSALKSAGVDAVQVDSGLLDDAAQDVDVAVGEGCRDLSLWRRAKRRRPLRPLVVVAAKDHEGALRGATESRRGPDGYVAWPGAEGELVATVNGAVESAGQPRTVSLGDFFRAMKWLSALLVVVCGAAIGPLSVALFVSLLLLGGSTMLGSPYAWMPRRTLLGGLAAFALGIGIAVYRVMHP